MPTKSNMTEQDKGFRRFERQYSAALSRQKHSRAAEPRKKFLTEELLRDRKALTKNGRQALVLQYGQGTVSFTLAELNDMARKIALTEDKMGASTRGVKVGDLLKSSLLIDRQRAKHIKAATLYKITGNTLAFQVTSSGETAKAPSHYRVQMRLDDWGSALRHGQGLNYLPSAQQACNGHISFDCTCGRHQYWYRYLATIGGFALNPVEHIFPKIRNPKLKGACCKHTLKVISTILSPVTQTKIAKEMERQAKLTNFETPRGKYVKASEAETLKSASEKASVQKAYREYRAAQKAFEEKTKTPAAKEALTRLQERNTKKMIELAQKKEAAEQVARKEIATRRQLEADMKQQWIGTLKTLAMVGDLSKNIDSLAQNTGADKAMLMKIAKDEGLL